MLAGRRPADEEKKKAGGPISSSTLAKSPKELGVFSHFSQSQSAQDSVGTRASAGKDTAKSEHKSTLGKGSS